MGTMAVTTDDPVVEEQLAQSSEDGEILNNSRDSICDEMEKGQPQFAKGKPRIAI
jgi:hypothetical protein